MTGVLTPARKAESSAAQLHAEYLESQFTSADSSQTFWEDRKRSLLRRRLVGFAVCVPLWVLSMIPLARESMEGRESILVYLTVGAISLGVAAAIRGAYVLLTQRRFLTPWLFVMAALVALAGSAVQGAGEVPGLEASALESKAA